MVSGEGGFQSVSLIPIDSTNISQAPFQEFGDDFGNKTRLLCSSGLVGLHWHFVAATKCSGDNHSTIPTMAVERWESGLSKSDHIWAQIPASGTQASESSGVK